MSDIQIRRARPADKGAVNALSAHIWEGEDYIPYTFDEWVADPEGRFSLAFEGNTLLGFAKLSRLGPEEWWLEGLRVHPEQRGQGIARYLHQHMNAHANTLGPGVLRFATNADNTAVHHLAESSGFRRICGYSGAVIETGQAAGSANELRQATPAEQSALTTWLAASSYFAAAHGLYEEHWTWLELAPRLQHLLAEGYVYWWQPGEAPGGVVIVDSGAEVAVEEEPLRLSYLDAPATALPALTAALGRHAAGLGRTTITSRPLASAQMLQAYRDAGWKVKEYELWIFERPLSGRSPS